MCPGWPCGLSGRIEPLNVAVSVDVSVVWGDTQKDFKKLTPLQNRDGHPDCGLLIQSAVVGFPKRSKGQAMMPHRMTASAAQHLVLWQCEYSSNLRALLIWPHFKA